MKLKKFIYRNCYKFTLKMKLITCSWTICWNQAKKEYRTLPEKHSLGWKGWVIFGNHNWFNLWISKMLILNYVLHSQSTWNDWKVFLECSRWSNVSRESQKSHWSCLCRYTETIPQLDHPEIFFGKIFHPHFLILPNDIFNLIPQFQLIYSVLPYRSQLIGKGDVHHENVQAMEKFLNSLRTHLNEVNLMICN